MALLKRYYADEPPTHVSLKEYCRGRQVIDRFNPPGAQRVPPTPITAHHSQGGPIQCQGQGHYPVLVKLAEESQATIRRVLQIMDALFCAGRALKKIDLDTFVVDLTMDAPKLSESGKLNIVSMRSASQVDENVAELADVIEDCLFISNNKSIHEVQEVGDGLFRLMRGCGNTMWYVILNHSSLIPIESRSDAYSRMYDTLVYVLKQTSEEDYKKVLKNLDFPLNWQDQVESNRWLLSFYCGSIYKSQDLSQITQAMEITRFIRNSCAHGVDRGIARLSRSDIAKLQMSLAPMLMHSLMTGLEMMGWLVCNNLHRYMVYCV